MTTPKTAVVTGANRGLGYGIAKYLGKSGIRVLAAARDINSGTAAVQEAQAEGADVELLVLDVSNESSIARAAKDTTERYGRIDYLVNNAGVLSDPIDDTTNPLEEILSESVLRNTFEINVIGMALVTKHFAPLLGESARIFNLSSPLGSFDQVSSGSLQPGREFLSYRMSKSAVNMFTLLIAEILAPRQIAVNSVYPVFTRTKMAGAEAVAPYSIDEGAAKIGQIILREQLPTGQILDAAGGQGNW
ncbi:SDR family NAD(P)-dependent oxidoreductase [Mycobacteroides abscessus]|uniref:SDR family NAD(P)-dependent oxidoreductase n=1 Tax=Mycobacteroides abscessus TaxID=36809 RepID=UPI000268371D|nr:SDR family NAD(P)-dependent oxidoreductase [Mycobacteroides abscessus]EIT94107.1 carbonyl reductase [NADPH] 1 [Mycobacteroides abscessus 4S-0726-RA]EIT96819.1 carbonyl reductase [NADPH] 1 [Mycobacteroides abscessus 4S-0303]EIT98103.1 carbonyl reductase [NADPH] 1 [Mycobacteroides abscessus 4S-0726-RB]EIV62935.1 carbonyl reductase [NADPH] 1 [Mycobacteroides abscessus 4S-0116-S]MBN7410832.1 SDR family NAD(P)-dependent oxidoreductase [Mycobacteroides abscessus subsp. abscessus]